MIFIPMVAEIRRRLLFMVVPDWSTGSKKVVKYKPKDFRLLWKELKSFKTFLKKTWMMNWEMQAQGAPAFQTR